MAPPLLNARVSWVLLLTLVYALAGVGRLPFGPVTAVFVAVFCWLFNDEAPALRRISVAALTGVATAVAAVSYTHLDVYKRQQEQGHRRAPGLRSWTGASAGSVARLRAWRR